LEFFLLSWKLLSRCNWVASKAQRVETLARDERTIFTKVWNVITLNTIGMELAQIETLVISRASARELVIADSWFITFNGNWDLNSNTQAET
jgi:hypothetical protein